MCECAFVCVGDVMAEKFQAFGRVFEGGTRRGAEAGPNRVQSPKSYFKLKSHR